MKVLVIQPWVNLGGAGMISVNFAYELQKLDHEVKMAALFVKTKGAPSFFRRVNYITAPRIVGKLCSKSSLAFFVFGPFFLFMLVWKNAKDVTILNPHNFPASWIAVIVGKLKGIPVVWTCNEPPLKIPLRDLPKVGFLDFFGWLFASSPIDRFLVRRGVSLLVVPSQKTQKQVKAIYGRDSFVNHLGINFDFFSKGDRVKGRQKYNLLDKFVLLTVGKLHPQKNQEICVMALRKVIQEIPNAFLIFAGDGPMREDLRDLSRRLGVWQNVEFLGEISAYELRDLYKACDLNLFPAKGHQSWGFVPIEALCSGKISVVSSGSGVAKVLKREKIGIVCQPTPEAFAKNILRVAKNKRKFDKMARKGQRFVRENLTWEGYTKRWLKII